MQLQTNKIEAIRTYIRHREYQERVKLRDIRYLGPLGCAGDSGKSKSNPETWSTILASQRTGKYPQIERKADKVF